MSKCPSVCGGLILKIKISHNDMIIKQVNREIYRFASSKMSAGCDTPRRGQISRVQSGSLPHATVLQQWVWLQPRSTGPGPTRSVRGSQCLRVDCRHEHGQRKIPPPPITPLENSGRPRIVFAGHHFCDCWRLKRQHGPKSV